MKTQIKSSPDEMNITQRSEVKITCVSSNKEVKGLVRKYSYYGDVEVNFEFLEKLSELKSKKSGNVDLFIIDIPRKNEEELFFESLRQREFGDAQIIVLCPGADAQEWHTYVLEKEITDYFVVRPLYDPNRFRIQLRHALERCSLSRLLQAKNQNISNNEFGEEDSKVPFGNSPFALFQGLVELAKSNPDLNEAIVSVGKAVNEIQLSDQEFGNTSLSINNSQPSSKPLKRVLLIEDNETNATIATDILESDGWEVSHAVCYDVACVKFKGSTFELAVVDLMVPGTSGADGIKMLKQDLSIDKIPIIVSSAHSEPEIIEKLVAIGIKGFVLKPITRVKLLDKVNEIIMTK